VAQGSLEAFARSTTLLLYAAGSNEWWQALADAKVATEARWDHTNRPANEGGETHIRQAAACMQTILQYYHKQPRESVYHTATV